jgi:hypothetical protein
MVCSSCRWRGSSGWGTPLHAYYAAPLKPSGAGKKRLGSAKLTMPSSSIVFRDNLGNVRVWLMNGTELSQPGNPSTIVQDTTIGSVPTNWSIVGQGDFVGTRLRVLAVARQEGRRRRLGDERRECGKRDDALAAAVQ